MPRNDLNLNDPEDQLREQDFRFSTPPPPPEVEPISTTNYQDHPITCIECGMRCTRPTPKTIRTKVCKGCRFRIRRKEKIALIPTERKGVQLMDNKKEIIVVKQDPPKKGVLHKIRIQRLNAGIQIVFESPILQAYFRDNWFDKGYSSVKQEYKWRSAAIPEAHPQRAYVNYYIHDDYRNLCYFEYGGRKLVNQNGKPNIGFLCAMNDYPVDDKGLPKAKTPATEIFRNDHDYMYMNPNKPIIVNIEGLFPSKTLDDYMMRLKELFYKIYSENIMPYDKSMIISMEEFDETAKNNS